MQIRLCAFACALAFSTHPARADEAPIVKVEISGARYDQRREDTAGRIVVGREELLRQGDRSLADVLKRIPGITIGGAGRSGDIRMRGLGNGYTQILLNGVAAPGGFTIDSLAPESIERIEIIRTASVELGTQAIAGTINIILKKADGRERRTMKAGLDRQGGQTSYNAGGEMSGKGEQHAYSVVATLARRRVPDTRMDEETREEAGGERSLHRLSARQGLDTSDVLSITPRLNWTLANGDALSAQGFASAGRRVIGSESDETMRIGRASAVPRSASMFESSASFLRLDLNWTRNLGEGARIEFKAGASNSARSSDSAFIPIAGGVRSPVRHAVAVGIHEDGHHFGGKVSLPRAGGHQLAAGWDAAHAWRDQTRSGNDMVASGSVDRYEGTINRGAVFLQDDWDISAGWSLSAGLRAEALDTQVADQGLAPVRQRTRIVSPVLQTLFKLEQGRQLRFGLTRSYKAPAMVDLIPRRTTIDNNNNPTNPDTEGNPGLRPEKAWGLDAAFERYIGKDTMFSASAYLRKISDVTVRHLAQDQYGWIAIRANDGQATARGVALEAKLPLAPTLELRANLARNWFDKRIDGQDRLSANLALDWRLGQGSVGASFNYRAGATAYPSEPTSITTSTKRGLDLYGVWPVAANTRLRLGASNLLRKFERESVAYDAGGLHWQTTMTSQSHPTLRATLEIEN